MKVIAYDPYLTREEMARARGAEKVELDEPDAPIRFSCRSRARWNKDKSRHDRRAPVRADAAACVLHHTARGFIHDERRCTTRCAKKRIAGAGLESGQGAAAAGAPAAANSDTCWRARTRRGSPREARGEPWAGSRPSRFSTRSTQAPAI